jgi:hypothetical protein
MGKGLNGTAIAAGLTAAFAVTALHGQSAATLPNHALTPGSVRTTSKDDICNDPNTKQYRHWTRARDDRILHEYGVPPGPHPTYEIDHLVPLDLGGSDEDSNLWPEPRPSIVEWKASAEAKDKLEWKLHDLVCSGQLNLPAAQREISENWIAAYKQYFR